MSASRRSNPFSYKLRTYKTGDNIAALMAENRRRCKHIYSSFMRRLKAAYRHVMTLPDTPWRNTVTGVIADYVESLNSGYNACLRELVPPSEWRMSLALVPQNEVANYNIGRAQNQIHRSNDEVSSQEKTAYTMLGSQRLLHNKQTLRRIYPQIASRSDLSNTTKEHNERLKKRLTLLKKYYPYVRPAYMKRLIALARTENFNVHLIDLVKAGIPAADVVGPWWTRTTHIKSPMDWVTLDGKHMPRHYPDYMSPTPSEWLDNIGLDGRDPALFASVENYYTRHKAAPSVKWAQERSNQLEAERAKKEIEGQLASVRLWLEYSEAWLETGKILIPILPGPEWKVLGPKDARKLCETAKRDGLCVVDVITSFVEGDPHDADQQEEAEQMRKHEARTSPYSEHMLKHCDEEGVCSLVLCTDPTRRTVVGLDANGICTSEHHCTGIQNKVDREAWEYFRKPHA